MTERDDRDLTGAWALDALTPEEREAFERYLASDDDARVEAIELQDTAAVLGLSVAPVPPPTGMRARVLASIEGVAQVPSDAVETPATAAPLAVSAARMPEGDHRAPHRIVSTGRRLRFTRRTAAMLVGSLVVLAALVIGGVTVRGLVAPTGDTQAISQIQDASDARSARSVIAGGGTATVVWSGAEQRAMIAVADAESTPSDRVYQLWFIHDGTARSAGLFTVGASGTAKVALDGRMRDGDAVGVTVEPKGGSTHPTTHPIVVVQTA